MNDFVKRSMYRFDRFAYHLIATMLAAGCSPAAQTNLTGQTVGNIVTNLVQHARAGDTNYFAPVLDAASAAQAPQLLAMIQSSGMLTNYSNRLQSEAPAHARLDYHYLERGCHFQVELRTNGGAWRVTRIWFCR